jgi:hypothetical protein
MKYFVVAGKVPRKYISLFTFGGKASEANISKSLLQEIHQVLVAFGTLHTYPLTAQHHKRKTKTKNHEKTSAGE